MIQTQPNTTITQFPHTPRFDQAGAAGIDAEAYAPLWLPDFMTAFGYPGLAALSWTMCSIMVYDIRAELKTFPFLEITGRPESGKTVLVNFLWKLLGYAEGEWKNAAALTRQQLKDHVMDLDSMPLVFFKDPQRVEPNFECLKPFYNGRSTGALGFAGMTQEDIKHGNQLFKGTLMIAGEKKTLGSIPFYERVIHCRLPRCQYRSTVALLEEMTRDELGGFILHALQQKDLILAAYMDAYNEMLAGGLLPSFGVEYERIIKTHTQMVAAGYALRILFPELDEDTLFLYTRYLAGRAIVCEDQCRF
ncbi:MAG: hypothetical protein K9L23_13060 [Desulfotignum sp.]|nr:hypothetical protein [Desulfotignum sp.]